MYMYMYMMQGSDVGFLPMGQSIPACDTQTKVISRLEYHIYRHCVSYDNFGEELMFDALQDMLNPLTSTKVHCTWPWMYMHAVSLPPPPPLPPADCQWLLIIIKFITCKFLFLTFQPIYMYVSLHVHLYVHVHMQGNH